MNEITNSVGTLITIIALTIALLTGSPLLKVLAGIGLVYTMLSHDEQIKAICRKEIDEYNAEVDRFNTEVDKYNQSAE